MAEAEFMCKGIPGSSQHIHQCSVLSTIHTTEYNAEKHSPVGSEPEGFGNFTAQVYSEENATASNGAYSQVGSGLQSFVTLSYL